MSERKVLNKYYPPDFDPSKIPKLRLPRNRQYSIRIMAPFNMRCNTCGEYIYKGKKFNSRKETVEDEDYLGLKIFRFYIKCPRCVAEIAFKTDPQSTDYALEGGATRNFEAMRTAEMLAKKEIEEKEQEELNNPMKVLENRTKASQQEMEMIETLEELRELNSRHAKVDHDSMVNLHRAYEEQLAKLQDEEDENFIKDIFGKGSNEESVKRLQDDDGDDGPQQPPVKKMSTSQKPTDFLTEGINGAKESSSSVDKTKKPSPWARSIGSSVSSKSALAGLVRRKQPTPGGATSTASAAAGGAPDTAHTKGGNGPVTVTKGPAQNDNSGEPPKSAAAPVVNSTAGSAAATNSIVTPSAAPLGLGLLGAYSDSDSDGSN